MGKAKKENAAKKEGKKGNAPEIMGGESVAGSDVEFSDTARDLQDVNIELLDRVKDLEVELSDRDTTSRMEDLPGDPGGGFFAVVRDLEGEIDATLALKDTLEADLETAREKLSQESAARAELEARTRLLESQAALADQLRQELSFVEEERDRAATVLAETRAELDSVTDERNSLTESNAAADAQNRRLQSENTDMEAEMSALNGRITDLERLRGELDQVTRERQMLEEKVQDIKRNLDTSSNMVETLKLDVNTSRELIRDMRSQVEDDRAQIEDLREELATVGAERTHARTELDAQMEVNKRLGVQIKSLSEKYRIAWAELVSAKKALRSLHGAAMRVRERTGRARGKRSGA